MSNDVEDDSGRGFFETLKNHVIRAGYEDI